MSGQDILRVHIGSRCVNQSIDNNLIKIIYFMMRTVATPQLFAIISLDFLFELRSVSH